MKAPSKAVYYRGVATAPYDLIKEVSVAMLISLVVIVVLSAVISSPDVPSATIQNWAKADPVDFVTTATSELGGTSTVANYGPPYTKATGSLQSLGFFSPQRWAGVHVRVDPVNDFVLGPLQAASAHDSAVQSAITTFNSASGDQQQQWVGAYTKALDKAQVSDATVTVPSGDYGPVPVLMNRVLELALSGGLDALLLTSDHFYQTDFSKPLLFINDGGYLSGLAQDQSLTGNQWGMMNETGRYPGQAWLWLYTMWYQIPPYNGSSNADIMVVLTMVGLSALLVLVPFIPGVRDLPRWIPIYKLIWRQHYAEMAGPRPSALIPQTREHPRPTMD